MANMNSTFNGSSNLAQPGFDGDLCATFGCHAANDPQFENLSAKQTIEARSALSGIANNNSIAFGNAPGLAQRALAGIEINTSAPQSQPQTPAYEQQQPKNG